MASRRQQQQQQPPPAHRPSVSQGSHSAGAPSGPGTGPTTRIPLSVKNVQSRGAEGDDGTGAGTGTGTGTSHSVVKPRLQASRLTTAKNVVASRSAAVEATTTSVGGFRTPQKRAIPREDVHPRNIVDDDDDVSPSPHKKSRSSKDDGEGVESGGSIVANTSQGISADLKHMNVDEGRTQAPPSAKAPPHNHTTSLSASASLPATTTTRIDKHSRLSAAERAAKDEHNRLTVIEWRKKYIAAFNKFAFYLDGFDAKSKDNMTHVIQRCGGRVEPFFDKSCSHVVTATKTNNQAPSTSAPATPTVASTSRLPSAANKRNDASATKKFSPSKKGLGRKNRETPLHSDRNPFEDNVHVTAPNASDVVVKATSWGIKVWSPNKFWSTMSSLFGIDLNGNVSASSSTTKQDLAKMLEHERIHGTSERDLSAPQSGFRYLDKRNDIFVLVGDATEEHHAIMFQQFSRYDEANEKPPWPKLYGELEGRCPFTKYSRKKERDPREQEAPRNTNDRERGGDVNKVKVEPTALPEAMQTRSHQRLDTLRREQSRDSLRASASPAPSPAPDSRAFERGASPYQLASGNSVSVASNITSAQCGSTASIAGNLYGSHGIMPGVSTPSFALQDKRVAQLGRRIVSAATTPTLTTPEGSHAMTRSSSVPRATDPVAHGALVRQMLGMTNDAHREQANKAHHGAVAPVHPAQPHFQAPPRQHAPRQHPSHPATPVTPAAFNAATAAATTAAAAAAAAEQEAAAAAARKDKEKKAYYCENCRKGFNNFDRHISSHEHRRFATNDNNFADLDNLFARLIRPAAPWVHEPEHEYILRIAQGEDAEEVQSRGGGGSRCASVASGQCEGVAEDESYETHAGQSLEWNTSIEENEGHLTPGTSPGAHGEDYYGEGDLDKQGGAEDDGYLEPYAVGEAI